MKSELNELAGLFFGKSIFKNLKIPQKNINVAIYGQNWESILSCPDQV